MLNWLWIQTMPDPANSGDWLARWRWDNLWVRGRTRAQAILSLKEGATHELLQRKLQPGPRLPDACGQGWPKTART